MVGFETSICHKLPMNSNSFQLTGGLWLYHSWVRLLFVKESNISWSTSKRSSSWEDAVADRTRGCARHLGMLMLNIEKTLCIHYTSRNLWIPKHKERTNWAACAVGLPAVFIKYTPTGLVQSNTQDLRSQSTRIMNQATKCRIWVCRTVVFCVTTLCCSLRVGY